MQSFTMSMTRGDTFTFTVRMAKSDGAAVPFSSGDTVYFTVRKDANTTTILIQKVITLFNDGAAMFKLNPEDTKPLAFGTYKYDVQLTQADGTVMTIIKYSDFRVTEEVTQ